MEEEGLLNNQVGLNEFEEEKQPTITMSSDDVVVEQEPLMTDLNWSDFVLKQFSEDEMIEGNPTVDGLRRVTRLLIGNIIYSTARVVQAPNPTNDYSATVEHEIVIHAHREFPVATDIVFREAADVNGSNTDPEFRRFATSTASTRAEARALRKALMLKRVVAAEEVTEVPPQSDNPGKIVSTQINFLDNICKLTNINVLKYISLGKDKYETIDDVPYAVALKMISVLSSYQREPNKIPESVKGYVEGWRWKK